MTVYFEGHQERYAVEQLLFHLLPQEPVTYPEGAPTGEDGSLVLRYGDVDGVEGAEVIFHHKGRQVRRFSPVEACDGDDILRTRQRRRSLQRGLYDAVVEILGQEPPWGMLSGVRPVKIPVRGMSEGKRPEEVRRALAEDYRVSPTRVDLAMTCAMVADGLRRRLAPEAIGLYVGIPFCPSRCHYCSFVSAKDGQGRLMAPYLEALQEELRVAGAAVSEQGLVVASLYIGGGTPTTLSAEDLDALLTALEDHFPYEAGYELTVEAGRADTITREKLLVLKAHGVGRISINPQTMCDEVLERMGRGHNVSDFLEAVSLAREMDFSCINMDLIAGLPGDHLSGFCKSLDEVLALQPENITIHTLARKRGSSLQSGDAALPEESAVSAMVEYARERLMDSHYRPYYLYRQKYMSGGFENIGWSLPGQESVYNIAMMEELCGIVSLGAGGISKEVDYARGRLTRQSNPKYAQEYIREGARLRGQKPSFIAKMKHTKG